MKSRTALRLLKTVVTPSFMSLKKSNLATTKSRCLTTNSVAAHCPLELWSFVILSEEKLPLKDGYTLVDAEPPEDRSRPFEWRMGLNYINYVIKIIGEINICVLIVGAIFLISPASADENIKFKSISPSALEVSGQLLLPKNIVDKVPAVIVVHGTSGIDERTAYFAEQLPKAGVAAFVVDFKSGVFTSPRDRPPNDAFLPAAFAALRILREKSEINPDKIAIIGFSLGGHLSITTSLLSNKNKWLGDEPGFVAHVSYYPGCFFLDRKVNSESKIISPVKIFWGTKDSYGDGEWCPLLLKKIEKSMSTNIEFEAYKDAHHGFDGNKTIKYYDPAALKNEGYVEGNEFLAKSARDETIKFLLTHLK
jgi:dienelactone hydrolase